MSRMTEPQQPHQHVPAPPGEPTPGVPGGVPMPAPAAPYFAPPAVAAPRRGGIVAIAIASIAAVLGFVALVVAIAQPGSAAEPQVAATATSVAASSQPSASTAAPKKVWTKAEICDRWRTDDGRMTYVWNRMVPEIAAAVIAKDTSQSQTLRSALSASSLGALTEFKEMLDSAESGDYVATLEQWRKARLALFAEVGLNWEKVRTDPLVDQVNAAKDAATAACGGR
ncbi:hypothetical protein [Tsukamurella hominis]|uniref:hypothetical protein n=1 Tax=Tsukamurella hominis TaxID=1970232 RepID=UPI0039EC0BD6